MDDLLDLSLDVDVAFIPLENRCTSFIQDFTLILGRVVWVSFRVLASDALEDLRQLLLSMLNERDRLVMIGLKDIP